MHRRSLLALVLALFVTTPALATEGMWQPAQLPAIAGDLKAAGLQLDPHDLTDLTGPTMGAIVSLGFCTASFVSPQGLVVTNHHCAYGAIQYNSTAERNLIKNGFLARRFEEELPGDPNLRVYVTEEIRDVTREIARRVKPDMDGYARYEAIDRAEKELVARCEKPGGLRCSVSAFYGGASYQLIRQREIRDVRLVYAPAGAVGKFGGDVDNWMWPRHTGDFSFLRAYVGKDGKSAAYSKDNVPYQPAHVLPVNADGVQAGDFVMVTGYPGRTNRYRRAAEVADAIDWSYPAQQQIVTDILGIIDVEGRRDPEVAVKYASSVASFNNALKNYGGQLEGLGRADAVATKRAREAELDAWLSRQGTEEAALRADITALDALLASQRATRDRDMLLGYLQRTQLYSAAYSVYRLAIERDKPALDRESGYQPRDEARIEGNLRQMERRGDPATDARILAYVLKRYQQLPAAQRIAALDQWLGSDAAQVDPKVAALYAGSALGTTDARLAGLKLSRKQIEASDDAAYRMIVGLMPELLRIERERKARVGEEMKLRPRYMQAMIAFNESQGRAVYPDANSSLRLTYGKVQGLKKDGAEFFPFTTLEGIAAKSTGVDPFDTPQNVLERIRAKDYGRYVNPAIGSVPVDFLADLDITGGNSGSPTLDARGRLVGLAFDGVWESVSADWLFNPALTRSIQVDVRYMLWVMDKVDGASNLLQEMGVR
ncbi:MAG TPA: S46 family peptidase [Dokdonella sp.]|nr:S46 family peptidase [Dokdonella sp.]HUD41736.1 S46 family peptidase [Dokdonella sp.]